jgi:hypothetical protein
MSTDLRMKFAMRHCRSCRLRSLIVASANGAFLLLLLMMLTMMMSIVVIDDMVGQICEASRVSKL